MKFKIKGLDDAITESGQMFNKFGQMLDSLTSFVEEYETRANKEYDVNLSDNSPYREVPVQQNYDLKLLDTVRRNILIFMYLPEELEAFEQDYQNILKERDGVISQAKNDITSEISEFQNLSTNEKAELDKEEVEAQGHNATMNTMAKLRENPDPVAINTAKSRVIGATTLLAVKLGLADKIKTIVAPATKKYLNNDEMIEILTKVMQALV